LPAIHSRHSLSTLYLVPGRKTNNCLPIMTLQ